MRHRLHLWLPVLMSLHAGTASALGVEPIRIELSPGKPTHVLRIRNDSMDTRLVQLEGFDWLGWDSDKHRLALTPSSRLIANPPVFTLAPKATQLVRVGLIDTPGEAVQQAFRLLVRELQPLQGVEPRPHSQISLLITFNLPVFFTPSRTGPARLDWHGERGEDGRRYLTAINRGEKAARITEVRLAGGGQPVPVAGHNGYLLAGQSASWQIGEGAGHLKARVKDDKGQWSDVSVELP